MEKLLLLCQSWFSEVSSSGDPELLGMQLDDFISIWNFGTEHGKDLRILDDGTIAKLKSCQF